MTINPDAEKIFTVAYDEWQWPCFDNSTRDGDGSTMDYTSVLRGQLSGFLSSRDIKSMLDASCGEWGWMSSVDLTGIRYIGSDIVKTKIEKNEANFPQHVWIHGDITDNDFPWPTVDLWFARDTLFHFPHRFVKQTLRNFCKSGSTYLMTSHYPMHENGDIEFGNFHELNLCAPPFSFPEPITALNDTNRGNSYRVMGLWRRDVIEPLCQ